MKWTVSRPRQVPEDDKVVMEVEADTPEDAIRLSARKLYGSGPHVGQRFVLNAFVEVQRPNPLPLRTVFSRVGVSFQSETDKEMF